MEILATIPKLNMQGNYKMNFKLGPIALAGKGKAITNTGKHF